MDVSKNITGTIAVAGGTGDLGFDVVTALLDHYQDVFPTIIVYTRSASSPKAQTLAGRGATIREIKPDANNQSLGDLLRDVDVLVDAMAVYGEELKMRLFRAALDVGVKVYFPSEFGVDYRRGELVFPGYEHSVWPSRRDLQTLFRREAAERGDVTKIVSVACGLFLNTIGIPELTSPMIPPTTRIAWTSKYDVGRAVAELSRLSLDPATRASVPQDVRIAGCYTTAAEYAALVGGVKPANEHEVDVAGVKRYLKELHDTGKEEMTYEHMYRFLRVLCAEGELDWSAPGATENELVNPGEMNWRWQSAEDVIQVKA